MRISKSEFQEIAALLCGRMAMKCYLDETVFRYDPIECGNFKMQSRNGIVKCDCEIHNFFYTYYEFIWLMEGNFTFAINPIIKKRITVIAEDNWIKH